MNPLHRNYKHTEAVKFLQELIGEDSEAVHSSVVVSPRAEIKFQVPNNVMNTDLVGDYINRFYQPSFNDEQLRQFSARLNMALSSRKVLTKMHLAKDRAGVKG